jgi:hypothetical protein
LASFSTIRFEEADGSIPFISTDLNQRRSRKTTIPQTTVDTIMADKMAARVRRHSERGA